LYLASAEHPVDFFVDHGICNWLYVIGEDRWRLHKHQYQRKGEARSNHIG